jgi:hypothetical protein
MESPSFPSVGAATDPLFWVAHGAVERLFQRSVFANVMTDTIYPIQENARCSGHNAESPKSWLKGLKLMDESVNVEKLTNIELSDILNPTSDAHKDYINFVYDSSSFPWCSGIDQALH